MILLDVVATLRTLLDWVKHVQFMLCSLVGVIMIVRIVMLFMNASDKRRAIEEALWWMAALAFLSLAPELMNELFRLLRP
ncbi:MAG: hypothetical protein AAGJ69_08935 [Cyanobacteria bacterium J06559_1]